MQIIQIEDVGATGAPLTCYLHDVSPEMPERRIRPSVIICPGGGYEFLSDREADPPAMCFFARGYNAFILRYSVRKPGCPPLKLLPLTQLSAAVMEVRGQGEKWGCAPDKIAVCGFSAGGHLAASLGVLWDSSELAAVQDTHGGMNRPDGMILCYPVITSGEKAHKGSIWALAGDNEALTEYFSLEKRVTPSAAPAFLWHTVTDDGVPVENSLDMVRALHAAGVPLECYLYEEGAHGLSLCNKETGPVNPRCATWMGHCLDWLDSRFDWEP